MERAHEGKVQEQVGEWAAELEIHMEAGGLAEVVVE